MICRLAPFSMTFNDHVTHISKSLQYSTYSCGICRKLSFDFLKAYSIPRLVIKFFTPPRLEVIP